MARPVSEIVRIIKQDTIEATKALLVRTAKAEHAKIMAEKPSPQSFIRIVDGRVGAAEEAVKSDGVIIYQYRRLDEIVQVAMETLFDVSPVKSGEYRQAHEILIDGIAVTNLKDWHPGAEILITNMLPYSRKIEVGKMTMTVPGSAKVYQQAQRKLAARFGNIVNIRFTYRGDGELQAAARDGKSLHQVRRSLRYPALIIKER